jgi:hypothetical protein
MNSKMISQCKASQRALAALMLRYLPAGMTRLVGPFCGSAASQRSAAILGCGFGHRPGACYRNWQQDAAVTRRRDACATDACASTITSSYG